MKKFFASDRLIFDQKGFTLLELLVVISIILIILASSAGVVGNLLYSTQLDNSSDMIVQYLRIARERSMVRLNNSAHGVYFDIDMNGDDKVILFQGESYLTRNSQFDRILKASSSIELSTTLPGNEVTFSKGKGIPDSVGAVTVSHVEQAAETITINSLGLIQNN